MDYSAKDIETLNFVEAIRTRIAMYMGSADNQGVLQCVREIVSNSIDEHLMGYGSEIEVDYFENNKIRIKDYARGCPFGVREDGTEALEAIFMTPHSGGKFNNKTYSTVIGLNGIGGKGVALSAEYFKVESRREGQKVTLVIRKGVKESFNIEPTDEAAGTTIEFIPDQEVYNLEKIEIDFEEIKEMCKNWSYLNKGCKFKVNNHITKENYVFYAENGLLNLIEDKADNSIQEKPLYYVMKDGDLEVEIALKWTKNRSELYTFTNGLENREGGTSLTGLKSAITRNLNREFNMDLTGETSRTGLVAAISCKIPNPSFANQTKTKINNPELRGLADKAFSLCFKEYLLKYPDDAKSINTFLMREIKAENAANKARMAVLNAQAMIKGDKKDKIKASDKLKDCEIHDENSILFITEGK